MNDNFATLLNVIGLYDMQILTNDISKQVKQKTTQKVLLGVLLYRYSLNYKTISEHDTIYLRNLQISSNKMFEP